MNHAPTTKPMAAHIGKKRVVATFVDLFIVRPKPTVTHEGDVKELSIMTILQRPIVPYYTAYRTTASGFNSRPRPGLSRKGDHMPSCCCGNSLYQTRSP